MGDLNLDGLTVAQKRLFAVRYARRVQHLMTDPRSIAALDVAERHAKGKATDEELAAAAAAVDAEHAEQVEILLGADQKGGSAMSNEDNEFMSKIVYHSRILENMGCTVVVFTPEELRGANPYHVQDRLIELGWEVIGDIAEDNETDRLVKPSDEDWNWAIK